MSLHAELIEERSTDLVVVEGIFQEMIKGVFQIE